MRLGHSVSAQAIIAARQKHQGLWVESHLRGEGVLQPLSTAAAHLYVSTGHTTAPTALDCMSMV
jgi:hypothetical protein